MGKPYELVDMEITGGINWKTDEPKIPQKLNFKERGNIW